MANYSVCLSTWHYNDKLTLRSIPLPEAHRIDIRRVYAQPWSQEGYLYPRIVYSLRTLCVQNLRWYVRKVILEEAMFSRSVWWSFFIYTPNTKHVTCQETNNIIPETAVSEIDANQNLVKRKIGMGLNIVFTHEVNHQSRERGLCDICHCTKENITKLITLIIY